ncbi:organic cation transporter protein-like [Eriocheir sinensis]|uniref:organic cation transporter protein-like n=1 Tax=Eriocheir sinensis TaxID=95602 RepID=UPI0021C5DBB0|nr:organic cation transporter protein-like [Eriocheir sinensis]
MSQLDGILRQLGTGKWNVLHFVALAYCVSLPCYHTLAGPFLAPKQNYQCLPGASDPTQPVTSHVTSQDGCTYLERDPASGKPQEQPCRRWAFDNTTFGPTVTSEFGLVCGREYLRVAYTSIYMSGVLVGAPLNGLLADKYGRRPTIAIGSVVYAVVAVASSWLPSLTSVLASRFLLGTLHAAILKAGYILAMEVSSPRVRPVLGIVMYLPWALGTMAWGGAAYLLRSWRWLQLSVSLLFLLFLPALLLLDESPRWLAVRGYHSHALAVLQRAARWNGVHLPPRHRLLQVIRDSQIEETASSSSASRGVGPCSGQPEAVRGYFCQAFILFRTPRLRGITLGTCYNYLAVGMVYYGLSFSGEYLSSDPYLYMVLMGLVEVPAYTLMIPVVTNCGRRSTIVVFFLLSGVMLLLLPFIPEGCGWVAVCLALVGKMTITAAFQVLALYSSELFPTEVRTRGTCTAFMMSRVGSMVSPFITEYLGSARGWMPSVVFGAASLVAGAATLGLPETGGTSLPDTITQLEDRAAGQGYRKLLWAMTGDMGGGWPCRARGAPTPQVAALLHHHAHLHTQNHLPTHLSADLPTQLPTPLPTQDDLPIQPPTHLHTYSYPSTSAHLSL